MSEVLKDYFYTGVSFSSFFVDEGVLLCMKYQNAKFGFTKAKYKRQLRSYLKKKEPRPLHHTIHKNYI